MAYTNSPLVDYTLLSPNHSGTRTHAIDRITIHCVVGQCSVETLGNVFFPVSRQASSNYGVGYDGRIGMYCYEKNRSWCSSSPANDQRAITIETASDTYHPYAVNDKAYNALIKLCADICKRNGKTKLLWLGSKDAALNYSPKSNEMVMTAHRWFAGTMCPGDYLYSRFGDIASKVNALLGVKLPATPFNVKVNIGDLNIRKGAGSNTAIIGQATKSANYVVTKVNGDWGYIDSKKGYIYITNSEWVTIGNTVKKEEKKVEKSPFTDVKTTDSNYKAIKACYDAELVKGYADGKFKPNSNITRAEICIIMNRLLNKIK